MSDNLEGSDELSIEDTFYGSDSAQDLPTDDEVTEDTAEETESEELEDDSESVEETEDEDLEDDDALYEFKADGESEKVTLPKLKEYASKGKHFYNEMEKMAVEKKQLQSEKAEFTQKRDSELQRLGELVSELQTSVQEQESSIDWEELRETDIAEYTRKKEQLSAKREQAQKAREQLIQDRTQKRESIIVEETQKMLAAFPEWSDEKVRSKDLELLEQSFTDLGFSEAERQQIIDHRAYKAFLYAKKYLDLKNKKPAEKKTIPKTVKSKKQSVSEEPMSDEELFYGKS